MTSHPEAVDLGGFFVLPGLIDMNVRFNGEWHGVSEATQAALNGGVTTVVYESNYFGLAESVEGPFYTDLGYIQKVTESSTSCGDALAVKCYLMPPGTHTGCVNDLQPIVDLASAWGKTLIVDPSIAPDHLLHLASPFRLESLTNRTCPFNPRRTTSDFSMAVDLAINDGLTESEEESPLLPEELPAVERTPPVRKSSMAQEVQRMRLSFEELSRNELASYTFSQSTASPAKSQVQTTGSRLDKWRPPIISTSKLPINETSYATYALNVPATWECNGLVQLCEAAISCPVVAANVASAEAVALLVDAQLPSLFIESAPHFFHFSSAVIGSGQTSLKNAPPIRSAENAKLLEQYLEQGHIHVLSSQHNPIAAEFKPAEFCRAVPGVNSIGNTFRVALNSLLATNTLPEAVQQLLHAMCYTPAQVLGLSKSKGGIAVGKQADFFVWNPLENCEGTGVYAGGQFAGVVEEVYLRGRLVKSPTSLLPEGNLIFNK